MASLPSVALTGTLKLEPEINKQHPSPSFSLAKKEKNQSVSYERSSMNSQLGGSLDPIKPLEFHEALSLLHEGTKIESSYYVRLLQQCIDKNSLSETEVIHAHMIKTGTHEGVFAMTFLINVYAKCKAMRNAQKVFDNLPIRNIIAWTTLMTGYVQNSQPKVAFEVFQEMLKSGAFPSDLTLAIALNACSSLNSDKLGRQLHAFIIKYHVDNDLSIGNSLCSLYSKFGSLESAIKTFQRIEEKNVVSWTAVISACGENGQASRGMRFFIDMLLEDIVPNALTFTSVLSLCCTMLSLDLGKQVHSLSIKLGYVSNLRITNSVLYLYLKCGCVDKAQNLFNRMETVNLITWNAMIAGYAQATDLAKDDLSAHHSGTEALSIYLELSRSGMKPDLYTLSSILTVCTRLVALEEGEQIHAQTIKSGFSSDVVVGTALVNMYNKCGSIEKASKTFVEMSTRTLISWTTMITSLAQHGQSQQALQVFEDMRLAGVRPNQITFVGVLAACSHAGMVDEAHRYFEMMQKKYKIKPVMDHYECLIDMFVKLGRLDEAFDITKKMSMEPSEFIWSFLIAGCRKHRNEELGFYAAEQVLKLKPKDIETYLMVLSMYISAGKWKDVSMVRKLMKEEKVGRIEDWSWISIKDKVHSFKTNNLLHSQNAEVHSLLEELLDKAKSVGYELQECMELLDEGEMEEKKTFSSTVHHSEKLAVAFGLLNTLNNAPLRIIKSINMCKDCHNFIKVMSLLNKKEIIIRDGKRLHKFVDGRCSCADFGNLL